MTIFCPTGTPMVTVSDGGTVLMGGLSGERPGPIGATTAPR